MFDQDPKRVVAVTTLPDCAGRNKLRPRVKQTTELLRQRYRPRRVRILFVGEAPPASGRFFYKANSGLYRTIRNVYVMALPTVENEDFLDSFCKLGCYLIDLCGTPVDRLSDGEKKKVRRRSEVRLSRILMETSPKIVIIVVKAISINVKKAADLANWKGVSFELPYPGRWKRHRVEFERGLTEILRKEYAKQAGLSECV